MQGTRRSFLKWTAGAGFLAFAGGLAVYFKKRNPWLNGGFKPVAEEIFSENLTVRGTLPSGLQGTYIRNGGNPRFPCEKYVIYDGDGMLHAVKIDGGKASYRNRFVRTKVFETESAAQKPLFNCEADGVPFGNRGSHGVVKHHGRLLALSISTPHEIDEKDLSTRGLYDFGGQWKFGMMPRPKIDPETEEMFIVGRDGGHAQVGAVQPDGKVRNLATVDIKPNQILTDLAITKNYLLIARPSAVYKDNRKQIDRDLQADLLIVPRGQSQDRAKSFRLGAPWLASVINAFEADGVIVLRGISNQTLDIAGSLLEWKFDLKTGKTSIEPIDSGNDSWPTINPAYVGRQNRFGYCGEADGLSTVSKICKFDFETREKKTCSLGNHCHGGDFKFVPDPKRPGDEDGGWLVGFVYNGLWWSSHLEIIDAATMTSVAQIEIPQRVPYGLVGTWIPSP